MTRCFVCLLVVATAGSLVADEPAPTGSAALQGRWKLIQANDPELRGDPDKPNDVTLTFDGDNFTLNVTNDGGVRELAGGFSVDPAPTPPLLDFSVRGDSATAPIYAIYRLSGERLTIRWRTDEMRPGDFTSPQVEFDATLVFRREKTE